MADHVDGMTVHLAQRDITFVAISRAPLAEIERFRRRMGWTFKWLSSYGTRFNYDFGVSFRPEEMAAGRARYNYREGDPGVADLSGDSVFFKDHAGRVFHTYSAYARGVDAIWGVYQWLDRAPKGRNDDPYWHRRRYELEAAAA